MMRIKVRRRDGLDNEAKGRRRLTKEPSGLQGEETAFSPQRGQVDAREEEKAGKRHQTQQTPAADLGWGGDEAR